MDETIARGDLPKMLSFICREAVKALKESHPNERAALEAIARTLTGVLSRRLPAGVATRRQDVEKALAGAPDIHRRSVFPEMNVQFGTSPGLIDHMNSPGGFRCHDDSQQMKDGA